MGQIADLIAQEPAFAKVEQLKQLRQQARQLGGTITNLAASYKSIRDGADAADTAALYVKLNESIAALKADVDALDPTARAIVDQVIDGVFGARA